jgi:hypothetical protein
VFRTNVDAHIIAEFIEKNPGLISADNAMRFLSDDGGVTYNRCHCQSHSITLWLSRLTTQ